MENKTSNFLFHFSLLSSHFTYSFSHSFTQLLTIFHRLDEQYQLQQESVRSDSLSWSDFMSDAQDNETQASISTNASTIQRQAKRDAITDYQKFQQQQQINPWKPTSNLARPLNSSTITTTTTNQLNGRGRATERRTEHQQHHHQQQQQYTHETSFTNDDTSTITTTNSAVIREVREVREGNRDYSGNYQQSNPPIDKIAPERRHYNQPTDRLVGSSARLG